MGDFDGAKDRGEQEDHRVCDGCEEDGNVREESQRVGEFSPLKGSRVDSADGQVLVLDSGWASLNIAADIAGFRAEEEVEDELNGVGL